MIDKLKVLLEDCTGYIIQQSEGIETRGAKYLNEKSNATTTTATSNQNQTNGDSSNLKLNELYASKFICEFVPHILVCFQQIFNPSKTQGKKGKEVKIFTRIVPIIPLSPQHHFFYLKKVNTNNLSFIIIIIIITITFRLLLKYLTRPMVPI